MNILKQVVIKSILLVSLMTFSASCQERSRSILFKDVSLPFEERVDDLVSRLNLEEKTSKLVESSGAIERLGIPEYNWWNESLHLVAHSGLATQFLQAIGMAASWNTALMFKIATVISDEARAKFHRFQKLGKRNIFQGLTFWSPYINLFQDPRWVRGMKIIPGDLLYTEYNLKEHGLRAEYFNNRDFYGNPVHPLTDTLIVYCWWENASSKDMDDDNFGVRWNGIFLPQVSGDTYFGVEARQGIRLYVNYSLIISFFDPDTPKKHYKKNNFQAGKPCKIKLEYSEKHRDARVRLIWNKPAQDSKLKAIEIARNTDAVLMFMGLSPRLKGEEMDIKVEGFKGGDRQTLDLPRVQSDLIRSVSALGKPVILILESGIALSVNWEKENILVILHAWYPGQDGGKAIADVLFGEDYNFDGRLPITFYKSVDVENIGHIDGKEVIQLYISRNTTDLTFPVSILAGFRREFIPAGKKIRVEFIINPDQLSAIYPNGIEDDDNNQLIISVGGRQPDDVALKNGNVCQTPVKLIK